jgi:tetracycline repressor-like protein
MPGIDPNGLHMTLNALCFFSVANRHTLEAQFGWDMSSPKGQGATPPRNRRPAVAPCAEGNSLSNASRTASGHCS